MKERWRNVRIYLRVPEVGAEIVGLLSELQCDDLVHFEGTRRSRSSSKMMMSERRWELSWLWMLSESSKLTEIRNNEP